MIPDFWNSYACWFLVIFIIIWFSIGAVVMLTKPNVCIVTEIMLFNKPVAFILTALYFQLIWPALILNEKKILDKRFALDKERHDNW